MLETFDDTAVRQQAEQARQAAALQRPMNPRLLLIDDDARLTAMLGD